MHKWTIHWTCQTIFDPRRSYRFSLECHSDTLFHLSAEYFQASTIYHYITKFYQSTPFVKRDFYILYYSRFVELFIDCKMYIGAQNEHIHKGNILTLRWHCLVGFIFVELRTDKVLKVTTTIIKVLRAL